MSEKFAEIKIIFMTTLPCEADVEIEMRYEECEDMIEEIENRLLMEPRLSKSGWEIEVER